MGQSSNDVIPTAIHITAAALIAHSLIPAMQKLGMVLREKSVEFYDIIKTGRTHLQDATPIRLGQEFDGYAGQADRAITRLQHALSELCEVAIGGTAVGTGVNTHPEFASIICEKLSKHLSLDIRETSNHFQSQSTLDNIVEASGVTKTIAVSLLKIANDIRWLGSGPRAGFAEISLPEVQPGSSIMPGKVNPVIPESVCQVAAQVIGNDASVTIAGQSGNFEINVMMPVAAYNLIQSVTLLASVVDNFVEQCLKGIKSTSSGPDMVERGLAICTGLVPRIGYDAAAKIAKDAEKTGKTVREIAKEQTDLTDKELEELLDPFKMTEPGITGAQSGG
jgi:fumarate hydratase class II